MSSGPAALTLHFQPQQPLFGAREFLFPSVIPRITPLFPAYPGRNGSAVNALGVVPFPGVSWKIWRRESSGKCGPMGPFCMEILFANGISAFPWKRSLLFLGKAVHQRGRSRWRIPIPCCVCCREFWQESCGALGWSKFLKAFTKSLEKPWKRGSASFC